jgi:hypothetical protein
VSPSYVGKARATVCTLMLWGCADGPMRSRQPRARQGIYVPLEEASCHADKKKDIGLGIPSRPLCPQLGELGSSYLGENEQASTCWKSGQHQWQQGSNLNPATVEHQYQRCPQQKPRHNQKQWWNKIANIRKPRVVTRLWALMKNEKTHVYMCGLKGMESGLPPADCRPLSFTCASTDPYPEDLLGPPI